MPASGLASGSGAGASGRRRGQRGSASLRRGAVLLLLFPALQIASCSAARRCAYEGFGRDAWQQPERVVEALALRPGDAVADLGAGGGYFTFRLADAVGDTGTVYAVDVDESMTTHLAEQARARGIRQIVPILAAPDDPKLPDGAVALVFSSNTYHHLEDRAAYFRRLQRDLAPGGRVAIVDFDSPGLLRPHYSEKAAILREMQEAGYALLADHDFLERQSFLVFGVSAP